MTEEERADLERLRSISDEMIPLYRSDLVPLFKVIDRLASQPAAPKAVLTKAEQDTVDALKERWNGGDNYIAGFEAGALMNIIDRLAPQDRDVGGEKG